MNKRCIIKKMVSHLPLPAMIIFSAFFITQNPKTSHLITKTLINSEVAGLFEGRDTIQRAYALEDERGMNRMNLDIKSTVRGVEGYFLIIQDRISFSDLNPDLTYISDILGSLRKMLEESHKISRIYISGSGKHLLLYMEGDSVLGVVFSKETNFVLLHWTMSRMLPTLRENFEKRLP